MTRLSALDLGRRAQAMLDALAALSDDDGRITRLYLSPAHRRSVDLVARWMAEAGLTVSIDALGTVKGALPPGAAGPKANRRVCWSAATSTRSSTRAGMTGRSAWSPASWRCRN